MRALLSIVLTLAAVSLVAACGGGGVNNGVTPVPFTSFGAVKSGQPVQANGISQTVTATTTGLGVVTATNINAVDKSNSIATLTYGSMPAISSFSFTTPASSVSFMGTNVLCPGSGPSGTCTGSDSTTPYATVQNPLSPPSSALAFNYQSFGYWLVITSGTSRIAGAISFGNPTPVASVPLGGTGIYNGRSAGTYIDTTGAVFQETATMSSTVDFATRSVAFSTSATKLNTTISADTLNLTGSFTWVMGSNQFSGTVTSPVGVVGTLATPAMAGTAVGQFYGPGALEIGGVYSLRGTGTQTRLGAFGGKQ